MDLPQSIYAVAESAAVDLDRADSPSWLLANCESKHFYPVRIGRTGTFVLQRLDGRWREPDFVELGLVLTCAGNRQMGVVYRIEATTENAETHVLGDRG